MTYPPNRLRLTLPWLFAATSLSLATGCATSMPPAVREAENLINRNSDNVHEERRLSGSCNRFELTNERDISATDAVGSTDVVIKCAGRELVSSRALELK